MSKKREEDTVSTRSTEKKTGSSRSAGGASARPRAKTPAAASGGTPGPRARATTRGGPRIRATHAEGAGPDERRSAGDIERRRVRARATVRALGGAEARPARKPLPTVPAKREGTRGPSSKRRSVPPPPARTASTATREMALAIAGAGLEKKAIGIEVIDVTGRVDYADYLVIMTGSSDRHVHAIAMGIEEALKKNKIAPLSVEGLSTASWVLMDYEDIVVHIFQEETRRLYDIEGLWMDAGRVNVPEGPSA
ncbi:MAG: ribosome silencing factor [Polyangiaceae bacterium]